MKKKISEINGLALNAKQMKELKGGQKVCPGRCGPNGVGQCYLSDGHNCECLYHQQVGDGC